MRRVLLLLSLGAPAPAAAQQPGPPPAQQPQPPATPRAAPSTQASVEVHLNGRYIAGRWFPATTAVAGPGRIRIDYGQPHARGREIFGNLVPTDSVWRTGANLATHLTTDVDVTIGDAIVPRGVYTLYTLPTRSGWKLIISRQVGQWGTEYDPALDLARVDLRARRLTDPHESLGIYLVPADTQPARGTLRIVWERTELSTDWRVGR
ncbi:MAG TPA: DUF2911 domain-containing protein [Gemmatimonadaceae bacterium]|nr:DUF2911 domain-containing protein [Gemmatimonadaceae bacterium]